MAMTIEELEIVIQAKVDKVVPQIRKMMTDVKKELQDSNIDFSSISNSINKEIAKTKPVIKKLKQEFNPDEISFTVQGEGIKKEIKGISNQLSALKGSKEELANVFDFTRQKEKLKSISNEVDSVAKKIKNVGPSKVGFVSYDSAEIQKQADNFSSLLKNKKLKISDIGTANIDEAQKKTTGLRGKIQSVIEQTKKLVNVTRGITSKITDGIIKAGKLAIKFLGIRKNAESLKNTVSNGVKTLMKYAMALIGIRSIYNGLKSLASEWLNSNDSSAKQLKANLDYMKMAIGSTLKPVIETIINLIYKAISAVQSLIYALSGVNIFAKMTASNYKSMAKSAGSASKATKQLAGVHNEINNISDNNSGGGSGDATPNIDLSKVDKLNNWSKKLYDFFKPLIESWNIYGTQLVEQIKKTASQIWKLITSVWESIEKIIVNGTVYKSLELILAIIGNIAEAFSNAWNYRGNGDAIVQNLANAFNNLLIAINNFVTSDKFQEWLNKCSDKIRKISEKLSEINWQPIIDALGSIGMGVGTLALKVLEILVDIFKWFTEHPNIAEIIASIAISVVAVATAINLVSTVMTILITVSTALNIAILAIVAVIAVIIFAGIQLYQNWDTVKEKAKELKDKVVKAITELKDKVKSKVQEMKESVVTKFNDLKTRALEKITNLKNTAVNTFDTIKNSISNKISNIKNTIVNGFESAVNYIKSLPRTSI